MVSHLGISSNMSETPFRQNIGIFHSIPHLNPFKMHVFAISKEEILYIYLKNLKRKDSNSQLPRISKSETY